MLRRILLACLLVLFLVACREGSLEPEISHLWVNGVIVEVEPGEVKKVLIEEQDADGKPSEDGYRVWSRRILATVDLRSRGHRYWLPATS